MYDYVSVRIDAEPCSEDITDLLAAFLAESEFETFQPDEKGLTAYIRKDKFDKDFVEEVLRDFPIETALKYQTEEIKGEDWNKEWEQNYFKPIQISDRLIIRSSFHQDYPKAEIEILIDPKMAFGTGHHSTTAGMSWMLLEDNLKGKTVIDMGTGTGILSILAKKLGAAETVGIDIDEFAIENAIENGELNSEEVTWIVGDDKALADLKPSDVFLANINLNVITGNLAAYVDRIKPGGSIYLSGFLTSDREAILQKAIENGLEFTEEKSENNWMVMKFHKPD